MSSDFDDRLLRAVQDWNQSHELERTRRSRGQTRWQEHLASQEMRFSGAILDAHERKASVTLLLGSGRRQRGLLAALGEDFCVVATEVGPSIYVALASLRGLVIDGEPRSTGPASARTFPSDLPSLDDILADLVLDRPRLRIGLRGSLPPVTGELWAVGADVISLVSPGAEASTTFLLTKDIAELSLIR